MSSKINLCLRQTTMIRRRAYFASASSPGDAPQGPGAEPSCESRAVIKSAPGRTRSFLNYAVHVLVLITLFNWRAEEVRCLKVTPVVIYLVARSYERSIISVNTIINAIAKTRDSLTKIRRSDVNRRGRRARKRLTAMT